MFQLRGEEKGAASDCCRAFLIVRAREKGVCEAVKNHGTACTAVGRGEICVIVS